MRMRSSLLHIVAAVFVLVTAEFGTAVREAQSAPVTGAIFTTLIDGSAVDHNIYNAKQDVYLNGGPNNPNAPCSAAGLPDGYYYFQVTDPSGKVLLSTDAPEARKVQVYGGYIVPDAGTTHSTSNGTKCGKQTVTVQLMPFADTPNPGGEYKAWMTKAEDYGCKTHPADWKTCTVGVYGFLPSKSKTDNFKVYANMDSDNDGLSDAAEMALGTNPYDDDTDHDDLTDSQEVNDYHTNPLSADTDGDGLSDYEEVNGVVLDQTTGQVLFTFSPTNPTVKDTDGDGWTDYEEVMGVVIDKVTGDIIANFTPTNPNSLPDNPDVDFNGNGIPDAGEGDGPPPA